MSGEHVRSEVEVGGEDSNCDEEHVVMGEHFRSVVAVASLDSNCDEEH